MALEALVVEPTDYKCHQIANAYVDRIIEKLLELLNHDGDALVCFLKKAVFVYEFVKLASLNEQFLKKELNQLFVNEERNSFAKTTIRHRTRPQGAVLVHIVSILKSMCLDVIEYQCQESDLKLCEIVTNTNGLVVCVTGDSDIVAWSNNNQSIFVDPQNKTVLDKQSLLSRLG